MLIEYFGAVGEFASADICLYDNPVASHTLLSVADIARIAERCRGSTHIKVTDTEIDKVAALRAATDLVDPRGRRCGALEPAHARRRRCDGRAADDPPESSRPSSGAPASVARSTTHSRVYARAAPFLHSALGAPDYVAVIKTVSSSIAA